MAVRSGAPGAVQWIEELEAIAARAGMRELLVRATLHRATMGEAGALDVARSLTAGIDNPALAGELRAVERLVAADTSAPDG